MAAARTLELLVLPGEFAVARLAPDAPLPDWLGEGWLSLTRTADELSVVCAAESVPPGVRQQRGWRCLAVRGPLAFTEVGVLAALAQPLADAAVSLFAVSTYDTDYLLVPRAQFRQARAALRAAGHRLPAAG